MPPKKRQPDVAQAAGRRLRLTAYKPDENSRTSEPVDESSNDMEVDDSSADVSLSGPPSNSAPASSVINEYAVNTQILCKHTDTHYYDAKITAVKRDHLGKPSYIIHYNGWNSRYDEQLTHDDAVQKFLPYTKENRDWAKEQIALAKKRKGNRATKLKREDGVVKRGRASTPNKQEPGRGPGRRKSMGTKVEEDDEDPEEGEMDRSLAAMPQMPRTKFMTVIISSTLEKILNDDFEMASRHNRVPVIPARISIDKIVNDYHQVLSQRRALFHSHPDAENVAKTCIQALLSLFNERLPVRYLLKAETDKYLDIRNEKRRQIGLGEQTMKELIEEFGDDETKREASPVSEDDANKDEDVIVPYLKPLSRSAVKVESVDSPRTPQRETRSKRANPSSAKAVLKDSPGRKRSTRKELPGSEEDITYTDVYGFVHLLRMLFDLNRLPRHDLLSPIIFNDYAELANDMLEFMNMKVDDYFHPDRDYCSARR